MTVYIVEKFTSGIDAMPDKVFDSREKAERYLSISGYVPPFDGKPTSAWHESKCGYRFAHILEFEVE